MEEDKKIEEVKEEEKTFWEKLKDFFKGFWEVVKKIWLPITIIITAISVALRRDKKKDIKEDKKEIKEDKKEIEKDTKELEKTEKELEKESQQTQTVVEDCKDKQKEHDKELEDFLPGLKKGEKK